MRGYSREVVQPAADRFIEAVQTRTAAEEAILAACIEVARVADVSLNHAAQIMVREMGEDRWRYEAVANRIIEQYLEGIAASAREKALRPSPGGP
jgi:hypothetical protein